MNFWQNWDEAPHSVRIHEAILLYRLPVAAIQCRNKMLMLKCLPMSVPIAVTSIPDYILAGFVGFLISFIRMWKNEQIRTRSLLLLLWRKEKSVGNPGSSLVRVANFFAFHIAGQVVTWIARGYQSFQNDFVSTRWKERLFILKVCWGARFWCQKFKCTINGKFKLCVALRWCKLTGSSKMIR